MAKAIVFGIAAVLFSTYGICEGLECYHCYSGITAAAINSQFVPCNEANLTLSNTHICASTKSQCIYEEVEIEATKVKQIWRTYSNGILDPCDPNSLPPGIKMLKCTFCGTDKCNLKEKVKENENEKNTFTFNINANINLFIRQ